MIISEILSFKDFFTFLGFLSFLRPRLCLYIVDVRIIIFVAICIYLVVFAQEGSLIECVLIWQVSSLYYLIQLGVKNVRWNAWSSVFLATKDKNVVLRNWTGSKPVFDVCLKTWTPDFNELPESRLLGVLCIESLNISDWWLISSKDIDVPLLNGYSSWEVPISIELWLLSPTIVLYWIHLTSFRSVIQSRAYSIDVWISNSC